jgi:hypothetical protein
MWRTFEKAVGVRRDDGGTQVPQYDERVDGLILVMRRGRVVREAREDVLFEDFADLIEGPAGSGVSTEREKER